MGMNITVCWNLIQVNTERGMLTVCFTFMWLCIVTNFFVIKPTRCTNFTNLFCHETLHVSDSCPSSGVYSLYTQQWYMSYRFVDSFRAGPGLVLVILYSWLSGMQEQMLLHTRQSAVLVLLESCLQTCMTYTIAVCTVNKLLMMGRRTVRNM